MNAVAVRFCPGCGAHKCACSPEDIRAQLDADRATLSARAAKFAPRTNEAIRLITSAIELTSWAQDVPAHYGEHETFKADAEAWLKEAMT